MFYNFCRWILLMIIGLFIFLPTLHAEMLTYEGVGEYTMTEFEMAGVAKQRAKMYAVRNAQSKAGTYIKSCSKSVDNELAEDEIIAISAGIVQIIDVKIFSVPSDEGVTFRAIVKINIDSDNIDEWLKRDPKERERLVQENSELQKSIAEQEEQIANLKKLIAEAKTPEDIEKIRAGFAEIDKEFFANKELEEGQTFYNRGDYFSAIMSYDKAVELNPNNFLVYVKRGEAYQNLNDYSRALSDYEKALSLNPNFSMAYALHNNRGNVYSNLKQYEQAIQDFDRAIQLNPNEAAIYNNRGVAYLDLKQYEQAIRDFDKAIQLNPNLAKPYYNRGICYEALGIYANAQADFAKAKSLGLPD